MNGIKSRLQLLLIAVVGIGVFYVAMQGRSSALPETSPVLQERMARQQHAPVTAAAPALTTTAPNRDAALTPPDRARVVPQSSGDAFAKLSWVAPAPVVHAAPPPPPPAPVVPVAPALPFTFVGLMEQGTTQPQAFLSKGNNLLVVAAGDVIDNNTYRVDSLSPQQIVITYLPLNTPQTLTILGTSK